METLRKGTTQKLYKAMRKVVINLLDINNEKPLEHLILLAWDDNISNAQ
jgi:hypothetical protein